MSRPTTREPGKSSAFLRALASGASVTEASRASRVPWNTLYRWRRANAEFRAAWDDAARAGADTKATEFEAELRRRAMQGVDEPVFHAGEQVGTRKRYSDALLMFALRELRQRRRLEPEAPPTATGPAGEPRVTVIVERLGRQKDRASKMERSGE